MTLRARARAARTPSSTAGTIRCGRPCSSSARTRTPPTRLTASTAVQSPGFYSPADDRIVLVVPEERTRRSTRRRWHTSWSTRCRTSTTTHPAPLRRHYAGRRPRGRRDRRGRGGPHRGGVRRALCRQLELSRRARLRWRRRVGGGLQLRHPPDRASAVRRWRALRRDARRRGGWSAVSRP